MAILKMGGTASLVLAMCAALLLGGCVAVGAGPMDDVCANSTKAKTESLTIKLKDGVPDRVERDDGSNGNEIHVCPGDYIRWKLDGSEFSLLFKDTRAGKVPFEWTDGKKKSTKVKNDRWKLIEVVRGDVDRGVPLKYDVINPAGKLDPLIIVER